MCTFSRPAPTLTFSHRQPPPGLPSHRPPLGSGRVAAKAASTATPPAAAAPAAALAALCRMEADRIS